MPKAVRTDSANNLQRVAEGRLDRQTLESQTDSVSSSNFIRMIVMDVVIDPNVDLVDEEKINSWHALRVSNMHYATVAPRNTIIAKRVGEESDPMFVFPFFPSHLSMPCKPGECVWVMLEKPDIPESDIAFWFSRVQEIHTSDDVNHTHPGRSFESSLTPSTKERLDNEQSGKAETGENVIHELRNGPVLKKNNSDERVTAGEGHILVGEEEDVFERIIQDSNASKLVTYQSVPRFRKRPGDLSFEGSNNTLIVLGTDRSGSLEKSRHESGAIDIVAGRGQTEDTHGVPASTTSIFAFKGKGKGEELKKELNKSIDLLKPKEGDPDFINDRSRILVSQKTSVDENFGLKDYNKSLKIEDDKDGDAGIVIKSDKIRLIARSDVEIIVTNFETKQSVDKTSIKDESKKPENWASIVIRKNGDVVITPAKEGYIKLGGDDANLAVLCSQAVPAQGQVKGTPIVDTMGGTLGAEGTKPTGEFATKVLLK